MDIEFDFKGDPIGGVITNCKYFVEELSYTYYTPSIQSMSRGI